MILLKNKKLEHIRTLRRFEKAGKQFYLDFNYSVLYFTYMILFVAMILMQLQIVNVSLVFYQYSQRRLLSQVKSTLGMEKYTLILTRKRLAGFSISTQISGTRLLMKHQTIPTIPIIQMLAIIRTQLKT